MLGKYRFISHFKNIGEDKAKLLTIFLDINDERITSQTENLTMKCYDIISNGKKDSNLYLIHVLIIIFSFRNHLLTK